MCQVWIILRHWRDKEMYIFGKPFPWEFERSWELSIYKRAKQIHMRWWETSISKLSLHKGCHGNQTMTFISSEREQCGIFWGLKLETATRKAFYSLQALLSSQPNLMLFLLIYTSFNLYFCHLLHFCNFFSSYKMMFFLSCSSFLLIC